MTDEELQVQVPIERNDGASDVTEEEDSVETIRTLLSDVDDVEKQQQNMAKAVAMKCSSRQTMIQWWQSTSLLMEQEQTLVEMVLSHLEAKSSSPDAMDMLLVCFEHAIKLLSKDNDIGKHEKAIEWCDRIVSIVLTAAKAIDGDRQFIVTSASFLLQLHEARLSLQSTVSLDFRLMTLVWKTLTKFSNQFASVLRENSQFDAANMLQQLAMFIESQITTLLQQLSSDVVDPSDIAGQLTVLRFLFRAFQSQFLTFANDSDSNNVERHLVRVRSLLSVLLLASSEEHLSSKLQADVERFQRDLLAFVGVCAQQDTKSRLNDLTRTIVQNLVSSDASDPPTQWNHKHVRPAWMASQLLLQLAFHSAGTTDAFTSKHDADETHFDQMTSAVRAYRQTWSSTALARAARTLMVELLVELVLQISDLHRLQLFLIKQTMHPHPVQRAIWWELWAEVLQCCTEPQALDLWTTLLDLALCSDRYFSSAIRTEWMQLIAFLFGGLGNQSALQCVCLEQVSTAIDTICSEGPAHACDLELLLKLELFQHLVNTACLRAFDHEEKEKWIAKYLPVSFDCCSTVLEVLNSKDRPVRPDEVRGFLRVLDVCLLVIRAVFDDNESSQDADVCELEQIILPLCIDGLARLTMLEPFEDLATSQRFVNVRPSSRKALLEAYQAQSVDRVLGTTLYLLSRVHATLKKNQANQCVIVMKDLVAILRLPTKSSNNHRLHPTVLVHAALFLKHALADIQVADSDCEAVWKLVGLLMSAMTHELGATNGWTPQSSLVFGAFFQLLQSSNIFALPKAKSSNPLALLSSDPTVQQSFQTYVRSVLSSGSIPSILSATKKKVDRAFDQRFRVRFNDQESMQEENQAEVLKEENPNEEEPAFVPQKRQRIDLALASQCNEWASYWSAASPTTQHRILNQESALFHAASQALAQLIARR